MLVQKECPHSILCDSAYFAQGLPGASEEIYIREGALERLLRAARALPEGYRFKLWDVWRPIVLQRAIFDGYAAQISAERPGISAEELCREVCKFVFPPEEDPLFPPLHATGGAVDLTIVDAVGRELAMGTGFDYFGQEAFPEFYERQEPQGEREARIRQNRRLLYFSMVDAGFVPDSVEWWHFNYGNSAWSNWTGNAPIYGGIFER